MSTPDYRAYVNPHARYGKEAQIAALSEPAGVVYIEDRTGRVFDRILRSLRRGSTVRVCRPFLLAPLRGRPKTRRARWLERLEAIQERGGKLEALSHPGLSYHRLAMIADEEIANSGRGMGRGKTGRPRLDKVRYTPEQLVIMEREWHSKKHKTRAGALKAIQAYGIKVKRGWLYGKFPVKDYEQNEDRLCRPALPRLRGALQGPPRLCGRG